MSFTKNGDWSKMSTMGYFEDAFSSILKRLGVTTYQVALSVGLDPSNTDRILFKKKPASFEKRLETLQKVAESPLIDVEFSTMARWLAEDYLPPEAFKLGIDETLDHIEEEEKRRNP